MRTITWLATCMVLAAVVLIPVRPAEAAQSPAEELYAELRAFELGGGTRTVDNLVLQRDRAALSFTGTFYFETPIDGQVHGAVFIGEGSFRSEVPNTPFDRGQLRRMIGADVIESDFSRAVFRFTDDTYDLIGPSTQAPPTNNAVELAEAFEPRLVKQSGMNISARLAVSILNGERPGFFIGEFDGGRLNRFSLVLDRQGRLLNTHFGINGGEKGLIFRYEGDVLGNDVWAAFYSAEDYAAGRADFGNAFDLVDTQHYDIDIDVDDPGDRLGVEAQVRVESRANGLRAIPFAVGESLPESGPYKRDDHGMRLVSVTAGDGRGASAVQEPWEGGLTVFLDEPLDQGDELTVTIAVEGDFMMNEAIVSTNNFYPIVNAQWYPRHGYLDRATFQMTFHHDEDYRVASTGVAETLEDPDGEGSITRWRFEQPVALVTFAVGVFDFYEEEGLIENVPVSFYSIRSQRLDEEFVAAEMGNATNYFSAMFGPYPYPTLGGAQHPRNFGQGFPSLLLMPAASTGNRDTFKFIAHETAHQWWGHIVAWRSYRDQWLSEGFAEYSGILYTGIRDGDRSERELLELARLSLKNPPVTTRGIGSGRLADIGPLILGLRLDSSQTRGAYQTLVYNKGALVLRMLHFLFSDPTTGDDEAFFTMMGDFVERHRNGWATTESFAEVASAHFRNAPLARMTGITDLNWFFQEWVYDTPLPSYRMEYTLVDQPDGSVIARGRILQENAPEGFFMPLPVTITFDGDLVAHWPVFANGGEFPFEIPLPQRPRRLELDPDWWVLSEETSTREVR